MDFGSTTQLLAQAQETLTGVQPYLWVAIGLPLGFYLARKVISLIPKK